MKKTEGRLLQSIMRGGFWVFLLRLFQLLLGIIKLVVLARILSPNDFGIMGVVLLTLAFLDTFSQTGFQTALIQQKKGIQPYLNNAWTILIIRGLALFVLLFLLAPYIAIFFNTPKAEPIIKVIGLSFLLQSFTNIGVVYFQKQLDFNKQFIYQLSGALADFIISVIAALLLKNVWALVFGLIAGNAVRFLVSYIIHPYRPHLDFEFRKTKELFVFGRWALASGIIMFLVTQGDDGFIGKFLGVAMLGFYQMAYKISNMPATEISHLISQVTFPAYSKIQDNIQEINKTYIKVLQVTAFISFPIAGLVFVLAPELTNLFLGNKWLPMVPAMQVLVFWGVMRSLGSTAGPVIYAVGKPKILARYQLFQLIIIAVLIYPFTMHWGILGTSMVVLLASAAGNIPVFVEVIRITKCGSYRFLRANVIPLLAVIITVSFVFLLKIFLIPLNIPLVSFILYLLSYVLMYLGCILLFDRHLAGKMKLFSTEVLLSIKKV